MAGTLYIDIVTPERSVFRGEATGIRAPGVEGSFEVLHNHAPMIAAFEIGTMIIIGPGGERIVYATSGGFLEVLDNHVTVLAETAEPASEIDVERARRSEERAIERMQSAGNEAERQAAARALERARNRARIAMGRVGTERKPA
jgi:F-type H+-transporting ATPase subunit epsilon